MFMLWNVFMNSEDLLSDLSSSPLINANFLYWLLNVLIINLRVSRGRRLLLDGNPEEYELEEIYSHTSRGKSKDDFNIKKCKIYLKQKPRENVETSMVWPQNF